MQLVKPDAPILRKVCRADFEISVETKGLGLAASQVGIDARFFVTAWGEVFVNPRVVETGRPVRSTEGCLSLPGVTAQVGRWNHIRLADGRVYNGTRALVVQHEIDHLDGILITDSPGKRHCII